MPRPLPVRPGQPRLLEADHATRARIQQHTWARNAEHWRKECEERAAAFRPAPSPAHPHPSAERYTAAWDEHDIWQEL
ncbi:hypothetical protein LKL35_33340 [Streptomyces sp. ET3-23]|uniref:hypothetical protein n=1 Tax=Streptomyces sp. ET3-23 TaxID=2885643 RepID=UPI001D115EAB|nr:hypothetical protein [Streptomyces sp. ET3-23]MCC2280267.1 hypothetical protein [Streptomyces sp. ET3-23]